MHRVVTHDEAVRELRTIEFKLKREVPKFLGARIVENDGHHFVVVDVPTLRHADRFEGSKIRLVKVGIVFRAVRKNPVS